MNNENKILPLNQAINLTIVDMLLLESGVPLDIHVASSIDYSYELVHKITDSLKEPSDFALVTHSALMRHKLRALYDFPLGHFVFLKENKILNPIENPEGKHLVLWDYLNLPQPLTQNLIYSHQWKSVQIICILRNMIQADGLPNLSLHDLVVPKEQR